MNLILGGILLGLIIVFPMPMVIILTVCFVSAIVVIKFDL